MEMVEGVRMTIRKFSLHVYIHDTCFFLFYTVTSRIPRKTGGKMYTSLTIEEMFRKDGLNSFLKLRHHVTQEEGLFSFSGNVRKIILYSSTL